MRHPGEETLRRLEICSGDDDGGGLRSPGARPGAGEGGVPKGGMFAAGRLASKLSSFRHREDGTRGAYGGSATRAVLDPEDAYRYVRCSARDGGISMKDLESVAGASNAEERRAVNAAVEELQNEGMVYLKEGKYFPL